MRCWFRNSRIGWRSLRTLVAAADLAVTQAAGLRAGQAFAKAYVRAKRAQGVADFNDLIAWTRRLFDQPGMGEWVRYKLDQRTDHILVDEAQDTNADQWAIVDALAGEFFSGNPEAERRWRTLFMVGDYKQAIYSFQGTDPKEFEAFRAKVSATAALHCSRARPKLRWRLANSGTCRSPQVFVRHHRYCRWSMR